MTHVFVAPRPHGVVQGTRPYESWLGGLFGGADAMADAVRGFGAKVAGLGGVARSAERCWASARR